MRSVKGLELVCTLIVQKGPSIPLFGPFLGAISWTSFFNPPLQPPFKPPSVLLSDPYSRPPPLFDPFNPCFSEQERNISFSSMSLGAAFPSMSNLQLTLKHDAFNRCYFCRSKQTKRQVFEEDRLLCNFSGFQELINIFSRVLVNDTLGKN